jgi:plasmid maintenance system antidote protein VapI
MHIRQQYVGGQLRPHAYSRYLIWSERFGPDGAMELIRHEMAHLPAFKNLASQEGITEEICLKFGETFDAAMTEEAWARLEGAYSAAEEFTQMKGALAAVVHPAGQMSVTLLASILSKYLTSAQLGI